ncbi:MAG: nucleoside triphosphate pyrophosphohydrolase [Eggerthellaceae bacterium]|nr:nucleoside triphosphate pyrophosphohydrolase [Eggerthellaceae bacterium]
MPEAEHPSFDAFVRTIAKLRSPEGGCPWNRAQTHESIGDYMIEEAYEAVDAIQSKDADHLREELGDVLLQVVLQSQIAADAGEFTIDDVCAGIDEKMIRRHPHVFGDVDASDANAVAELWEQVKLAEKQEADAKAAAGEHESLLDAVPTHFPALLQAQKISRKAVAVGFEWETLDDVWNKVAEERAELEEAYAAAPKSADGKVLSTDSATRDPLVTAVELEFGDLLFVLVNIARKMGIDAEGALRASNEKFRKRFAKVEQGAWSEGRSVEDLTLAEMDAYWERAKEDE